MTEQEFWAERLADQLTAVEQYTAQALAHAAAQRTWDAMRDTHAGALITVEELP